MLPTPNSHIPTPKSHIPHPTSQLPSPNSQVPSPNSQISYPNSQVPTPKSQLPTLTSQLSHPKSSKVIPESFVENIRVRQLTVYKIDHLNLCFGAGNVVRKTDDLLMEDVLHPCFLDTGDGTSELIHPNKRHLVAYLHPGDHRVDAIKMQLIKIQSHLLQGIVTSHLEIRSEEHTSELQSRPHLVCRL